MKAILCVLLISVALTQCFALTGYTSRAAFDAATVGYIQNTVVNFDGQAEASAATDYGNLSNSASGLDSDGSTSIDLQPVATASFPTTSSPHAMGPRPDDHQFLAGNSDVITFSFSSPVYAFGVYLIGNPSPTGNPAIPFWTMMVGRFTAESATDPIYTIGPGSDVYFLGVVSTNEPFSSAVLSSDNDPAAVFSFNVDDLVYATLPDQVSILDAKIMASGYVRVSAVVTRAHTHWFNIEEANRTAGIAVVGSGTARGKAVSLLGNLAMTPDGERVIELTQILNQTDAMPSGALGMGSKSVGGLTTVGQQIGIPGSLGPNNIGLDACIWGKITAISPDGEWITVDDGAQRPLVLGITGVVVLGEVSAAQRSIGDYVVVRGSVSIVDYEGTTHLPAIRVAQPQDITP